MHMWRKCFVVKTLKKSCRWCYCGETLANPLSSAKLCLFQFKYIILTLYALYILYIPGFYCARISKVKFFFFHKTILTFQMWCVLSNRQSSLTHPVVNKWFLSGFAFGPRLYIGQQLMTHKLRYIQTLKYIYFLNGIDECVSCNLDFTS